MEISEKGKVALIKVAEWLEAGAPHVDVDGRKLDIFDMREAVYEHKDCGTACCIAGAVYQFENLKGTPRESFYSYEGVGFLVNEFLGTTSAVTDSLFMPWDYFDGRDEFFSDPKVAAPVIRKFVETGVVEWPEDPEYEQ